MRVRVSASSSRRSTAALNKVLNYIDNLAVSPSYPKLSQTSSRFPARCAKWQARVMANRWTAKQQWRTAIHEAGHAVIGRALGLRCGRTTIVADYDLGEAGHAIQGDRWQTDQDWEARGKYRHVRSAVRGHLMALMAGAEAERVILGRSTGGDIDDRYQINSIASLTDADLPPTNGHVSSRACGGKPGG